ncbi:uncharacterized protein LOC144828142 [Lissotriton helveticus]
MKRPVERNNNSPRTSKPHKPINQEVKGTKSRRPGRAARSKQQKPKNSPRTSKPHKPINQEVKGTKSRRPGRAARSKQQKPKIMSSQATASYIKSRKGNRLLQHCGYIYCNERLSEPRKHWRCVKYYSSRCSGRAVTIGDIVVNTTDHNHSASAMEIEVRQTINEMKDIASTSNETPGSILREVAQHVPGHIACNMPMIPNLRRIIQRKKQASNTHTVTPQTFADITIPHDLTLSFSNEPFLLYDNENPLKRILILSTPRNLFKLENSEIWMMDGTFKCTPHPFTQIYSIHAQINSNVVPLVYSLLPDKQSATYTEFLTVIKDKTSGKSPQKIIIDFELTMINVINKLYVDTQIQGCFFHFSQAYWRKLQKTSLVTDYCSDSKLQFE